MPYCKGDDAQICDDCGALIADGYRPEHTRFHEVVTSLSLDTLKRLKETAGSAGETTPDRYEVLRRDVREMRDRLAMAVTGGPADPRDERSEALRREVARLRAVVTRMVELPREPEALPDDEAGRAYLRGWQDMRALVDKALLPDEGEERGE